MAFHFFSSSIPELKDYNFTERAQIISSALGYMTVPQKFALNMAKLIILVPLFILVARNFDEWSMAWPAIIAVLGYPLLINPLQLHMAQKNLGKGIKEFKRYRSEQEAENEDEQDEDDDDVISDNKIESNKDKDKDKDKDKE